MSRVENFVVPSARTVCLIFGEWDRAIAYRSFDLERGCLDLERGTWNAIEKRGRDRPRFVR
jgi:hypothetical protein